MDQRSLMILAGLVALLGQMAQAAPARQDGATRPPNEIEARVAANYLALPRVHVTVEVEANRRYRALDLEVWLLPKGPENLMRARSAKKAIVEAVRDDLAGYSWEAFEDSERGPEVAKKVVATSVERASGAKLDDVLIKTLLLK
jgi:hypothetical protein